MVRMGVTIPCNLPKVLCLHCILLEVNISVDPKMQLNGMKFLCVVVHATIFSAGRYDPGDEDPSGCNTAKP